MIILGIDPGYALVGFGVIETIGNHSVSKNYGCIKTSASMDFFSRMKQINTELKAILSASKPQQLSIEKLYFSKNTKTAIDVAQVRGAIIQEALNHGLDVYEYSPNEVKLAITGYGAADKPQMQKMVQTLLKLATIPKPDDTADALALALCHANMGRFSSLQKGLAYV